MSTLYITDDVTLIDVTFDLDIRPVPGQDYDNIQINVKEGVALSAINPNLAQKATVNLPDAEYDYEIVGEKVNITLDGKLVAAMPVFNAGTSEEPVYQTTNVTVGDGDVANIKLVQNEEGGYDIDQTTEPTPDADADVTVDVTCEADYDANEERDEDGAVIFQLAELSADAGTVFITNFTNGDKLATPESIAISSATVEIEARGTTDIRINVSEDISDLFADTWLVTLEGVGQGLRDQIAAEENLEQQIELVAEVFGEDWLM